MGGGGGGGGGLTTGGGVGVTDLPSFVRPGRGCVGGGGVGCLRSAIQFLLRNGFHQFNHFNVFGANQNLLYPNQIDSLVTIEPFGLGYYEVSFIWCAWPLLRPSIEAPFAFEMEHNKALILTERAVPLRRVRSLMGYPALSKELVNFIGVLGPREE